MERSGCQINSDTHAELDEAIMELEAGIREIVADELKKKNVFNQTVGAVEKGAVVTGVKIGRLG
jgi:hypothetical protein